MFYAIAALACNLMAAVKLLCLPDECQSWTVPTRLKQMVRLPAMLVRHAQRLIQDELFSLPPEYTLFTPPGTPSTSFQGQGPGFPPPSSRP